MLSSREKSLQEFTQWWRNSRFTNLSSQSKSMLPTTWQKNIVRFDIPETFINEMQKVIRENCREVSDSYQSELLNLIAESDCVNACKLISKANEKVNEYSLRYGNTPLLLAISKGWNHINTDRDLYKLGSRLAQKEIIEALLAREDLNINSIHFENGMTALHLACLRGDDPELIKKLIQKGADMDARDFKGKTPLDYLSSSYAEAQAIILTLTGSHGLCEFGSDKSWRDTGTETFAENLSYLATIPTREERDKNILDIRNLLEATSVNSNDEIDSGLRMRHC